MSNIAEEIEKIAKSRGFFYPGSEIYGGIAGFYDYGHLGTLMRRKFENLWRKFFLGLDDNFYEIETTNIMPKNVFLASGHVDHFVDPVVKCMKCSTLHRADHILEDILHENFEGLTSNDLAEIIKKHKIKCPKCKGELGKAGVLNMMFPVSIGAEGETQAFLRAETAQGPYVSFKRQFEVLRKRLPMGLAVIGRAYRNEISPRNILMRMREFTQAELQIFFNSKEIDKHPKFREVANYKLRLLPVKNRVSGKIIEVAAKDAKLPKFYVYYMARVQQFYLDVLKLPKEKFRFRELSDEEKAFYNKYHWDIELDLESVGGFKEMAGIHYRTDHDLSAHERLSKKDMSVTIDDTKFIPHVLELSFGIDRNLWALLELSYKQEKERVLFKLSRLVAPLDIAVFPLVSKDKLPEKAKEVYESLQNDFSVFFDESGSIGRRYRRMDEAGCPLCITIDYDSLKKNDVTVRDRDSMKQIRVKIKDLAKTIQSLLNYEIKFENAGKLLKV